MKKTTRSAKSQRNGHSEPTHLGPQLRVRVKGKEPQSNTVEYRARDGRHIVTLNLGEGAFLAVRAVAYAFEHRSPESYILGTVCNDAAQMLTQITEEEAAKFVAWQGVQEYPAQTPTPEHEITLRLSEKAYTILAGEALASGYGSPEHMILAYTSSTCSQSGGDRDEKEYAKMFGLTVAANGDTTFPNAQSK